MTKLYQVVNDEDEIVSHKLRHEIDWKHDIYRISALWLTNSKGEVLIAQRVLTKDKDPGKWGPAAAGTLEEGETYETNIHKEAEEEIGLVGVEFTKGPLQRMYEPRQAFCQWFLGVCDKAPEDFRLQAEEVASVCWISPVELKADLGHNPQKYVPSMLSIVELFLPGTPGIGRVFPADDPAA